MVKKDLKETKGNEEIVEVTAELEPKVIEETKVTLELTELMVLTITTTETEES